MGYGLSMGSLGFESCPDGLAPNQSIRINTTGSIDWELACPDTSKPD
ncbi:unnamed protein product [Anisakis simplex]|uniref:Uncharacterized protein n=1 Tax=Anisakis simplex TaxID=6269 RepID=A0A0M3JLW0_ANISI|nr:unnamed protein product [Anisakis simplex]